MLAQLRQICVEALNSLLVRLAEFGGQFGILEHLHHLEGENQVSSNSLSCARKDTDLLLISLLMPPLCLGLALGHGHGHGPFIHVFAIVSRRSLGLLGSGIVPGGEGLFETWGLALLFLLRLLDLSTFQLEGAASTYGRVVVCWHFVKYARVLRMGEVERINVKGRSLEF